MSLLPVWWERLKIWGLSKLRRILVSTTLFLTVFFGGCVTTNDPLVDQFGEGDGQNYISGDGSITVLAPEARQDSISFSGPLDTGGTFDSSDYTGNVLVVNFWYAGCPPCRLEAPALEQVKQYFQGGGVTFVGVNILDQQATARTFASEFGISYPSIIDTNSGAVRLAFAGQVAPNAVPTTLVVDRQGRVAARLSGLLRDPEILKELVRDVSVEETD